MELPSVKEAARAREAERQNVRREVCYSKHPKLDIYDTSHSLITEGASLTVTLCGYAYGACEGRTERLKM